MRRNRRPITPLTYLLAGTAMLVLMAPRPAHSAPTVVWAPAHVAPMTGGAR